MLVDLWILVAVCGAAMKTAYGMYQKHITDEFDTFQLTYILSLISVAIFLPLSVVELSNGVSFDVTWKIAAATVLKAGLSVVSIVAVFKAYETEDVSVFVPLVRVSPLLIALLEPLLFPTELTIEVLIASLLGVAGAYIVMLEDHGLLEPLRRIREPGPQLALFVAGCSTVGALSTRYIGVENVPPSTFGLASNVVMVVLLVGLLSYRGDPLSPRQYLEREYGILAGLSSAREYVIIVAYSMASAARVSLVFQLGILFTVIAGGVFFDEKHLKKRFVGGLFIIAGVVLVSYGT